MNMYEILAYIREREERVEKAEQERDAAIKALSDEARLRGEAEGRLDASEMAGVVDGWKARAEAAEAKVERLMEALKPFSEIAAEMFMRNWNRGQVAISFYGHDGDAVLLFDDFLAARAALAAMEATDE